MKKENKESYIHIRCNSRLKAGAVKTAQKEGKTLSKWLTDMINAAILSRSEND